MSELLSYNHIHIADLTNIASHYALFEIKQFLTSCDLKLDNRITDFIEVRDAGELIACGGVDNNIIKCVAINSVYRGEGIVLRLMSELLAIVTGRGIKQVFLYTKPDNIELFTPCGFYPLVSYQDKIVLMENSATHLQQYCQTLAQSYQPGEKIGCIVMNANPFTLGHRYLIEQAIAQCDWLHLFLVKEDRSQFCYQDRLMLVKQGIADIARVTVHEGSEYIISSVSFPNYFIKNEQDIHDGFTAIDLTLFRQYIAPALGVNMRFVGHEPLDNVTNQYNQDMRYYLQYTAENYPAIDVVEITRKTFNDQVISASRVRAALKQHDFATIKQLVPLSTYDYLVMHYAEK